MQKNPYYRLKYFNNIPYLITFGQGNADYLHDLQLNETGAFLWTQLDNTSNIDELTMLCIRHFQCTQAEYSEVKASVDQFINTLCAKEILIPAHTAPANQASFKVFKIAGLFCRFYAPQNIFFKELLAFETHEYIPQEASCIDITIQHELPIHLKNGTLILRNESLSIIETADTFLLLFPSFLEIKEANITKSGKEATLYSATDISSHGISELSYAVRILFLYFAQRHHMAAIHSASILYEDKLWLFSGASGIGKSTHTNLWNQILSASIINGDLNLITMSDGLPLVHGIPWCGTSGIYSTESYPLGGIIFLEQGTSNKVIEYTPDRKQLSLLHRCISPSWTAALQEQNCNILEEIYDKILICKLICTPDSNAITCIKDYIDKYLHKI